MKINNMEVICKDVPGKTGFESAIEQICVLADAASVAAEHPDRKADVPGIMRLIIAFALAAKDAHEKLSN